MEITKIILAAGQGSRMRGTKPKVLHKICGKSVIEYVMKSISDTKGDSYVVVNHHTASEIDDMLDGFKLVYQRDYTGTGGAVRSLLEQCDIVSNEYVLISPGDMPLMSKSLIGAGIDAACNNGNGCVVYFKSSKNNMYGGITLDSDNYAVNCIEGTPNTPYKLCNSGLLIIKKELLYKHIFSISPQENGEIYLTNIINMLYLDGHPMIGIEGTEEECVGVNTISELCDAYKMMRKILITKILNSGAIIYDPDSLIIEDNVTIEAGAIIHPHVVLGANTHIMCSAEIRSFSHIEGAKISANAVIGPFARIRANAHIGENAKVGNFAEIKNTTVGRNTKISHMSYVGDADIGENVNIGAGAVFCNYDGKNKYHTQVDSGAFIGSNASIVAPVHLQGYVSAGSVITDDVPYNNIAFGRSKQENIARTSMQEKQIYKKD